MTEYTHSARLGMWRRGRGKIEWVFYYYQRGINAKYPKPGWYAIKRKNVYRLTIDHDYPHKTLYLGTKVNGNWRCVERLYEPLYAYAPGWIVLNSTTLALHPSRKRSWLRKVGSSRAIREFVENQHGPTTN